MARIDNLSNYLTDVAGAIKAKLGDETPIPAEQFDTKIASIPSGGGGAPTGTSQDIKYTWFYISTETEDDKVVEQFYKYGDAVTPPTDIGDVDGLVFDGWSLDATWWNVAECDMIIGAHYYTQSGNFEISIKTTEPNFKFTINFGSSALNVDWGDGTTQLLNGVQSHVYVEEGVYYLNYKINGTTITPTAGVSIDWSNISYYPTGKPTPITRPRFPKDDAVIANPSFNMSTLSATSSPIYQPKDSAIALTGINGRTTNLRTLCLASGSFTSFTGRDGNAVDPIINTPILYSGNDIDIAGWLGAISTSDCIIVAEDGAYITELYGSAEPAAELNLGALVIKGDVLLALSDSPISQTRRYTSTFGIFVKDELVATYKAATNWSSIADFIYPMSEYMQRAKGVTP